MSIGMELKDKDRWTFKGEAVGSRVSYKVFWG